MDITSMEDLCLTDSESIFKRSPGRVNLSRVTARLDECFLAGDLAGAGRILDYWEREARLTGDREELLSILDERLGYCRRTGDEKGARETISEAMELVSALGLEDTVSGATVAVNAAAALCAFGRADEGMPYFEAARKVYGDRLPSTDFRRAALLLSMAPAYGSLGQISAAEEAYTGAISILGKLGGHDGEIAFCYIGLSHLFRENGYGARVPELLDLAWQYLASFRSDGDPGAIRAIASACAPAFRAFGQTDRADELSSLADDPRG